MVEHVSFEGAEDVTRPDATEATEGTAESPALGGREGREAAVK